MLNDNGFMKIVSGILTAVLAVLMIFLIYDYNSKLKAEELALKPISDDLFHKQVGQIKEAQKQKDLEREAQKKQEILEAEQKRKEEIKERIPGIICWGDGFTAGAGGEGTTYPDVLNEYLEKDGYDIKAINAGVGGEGTKTIMARAGGLEILTTAEFTIPEDNESPVRVRFETSDESDILPLRQSDEVEKGITNVTIAGIEGQLSIDDADGNPYYYFTRNESGEEETVPEGTRIINDGSVIYKDFVPIIFIGQNGGWDSPEDLIEQQEKILENSEKNKDNFLILGLPTGSKEEREELESIMLERWGDNFINLREYLSTPLALEDRFELSEEDLESMENGIIPEVVFVDGLFNSEGYKMIGEVVYYRLLSLGYIEK